MGGRRGEGAQADGASAHPSISADGRLTAFSSVATNLVAADTNAAEDAFVFDRSSSNVTRVSVGSSGAQGSGAALWPAISADGLFVAFPGAASSLVTGDTNACLDVFVHGPIDPP